jgi:hypothetical protein
LDALCTLGVLGGLLRHLAAASGEELRAKCRAQCIVGSSEPANSSKAGMPAGWLALLRHGGATLLPFMAAALGKATTVRRQPQ